jgi:hypothetical protein
MDYAPQLNFSALHLIHDPQAGSLSSLMKRTVAHDLNGESDGTIFFNSLAVLMICMWNFLGWSD